MRLFSKLALATIVGFASGGLIPASHAQGIGTFAGPTLGVSRPVPNDMPSAFSRTSFSGGIAMRIRSTERFAVQPELLYQYQREGGSNTFGGSTPDYEFTLHTLALPILAKVYFGKVFNLQAGPQMDFLLSAWQTGKVSRNGFIQSDVSREVTSGFPNLGFGLNVGAGADLLNGLFVNLRLHYGLSGLGASAGQGVRSSAGAFSVGYLFGATKQRL